MKALKIFAGIIIATSLTAITFTSCDEKKTRAEIEKDFANGDDSDDYEDFATAEKRSASSADPSAFNGSLPEEMTDEQKKKLEEEKKKKEAEKAEQKKESEDQESENASEHSSSESNGESSTHSSDSKSATSSAEPAKAPEAHKAEQPAAPAKPVISEPAKSTTTNEQPAARQQVIVTKSEPKKRDVVVDGQAQ